MNNKKASKKGSEGFIEIIGCAIALVVIIIALAIFSSLGTGKGIGKQSTTTADTVASIGEVKMPYSEGKVGHEEHFRTSCITGGVHFSGPLSNPLSFIADGSCGSFGSGMSTDQEHWYFNMRWEYTGSNKDEYRHKKVIVTNPANGIKVVASIEEYGPHECLYDGDCEAHGFDGNTTKGMNAGASPEVYNCYETIGPYTSDPDAGKVQFGLAKDQNIPLGPVGGKCK